MTGSKSVSSSFLPRRRVLAAWALLTFLAILLSLATGERTQRAVFDGWQRASPRDLAASEVRIVMIDGESLKAVGSWPWPRYYLARLTEEIAVGGAKAIGFDILFPEPDPARPELLVQLYPELGRPAAAEVAALEPMDLLFGRVIGRSPVVLARAGSGADAATGRTAPVEARFSGKLPPATESWPGVIASIPDLDAAALGHGLINSQPDSDGVVRTAPLVGRVGGETMPGLALEMARIRLGTEQVAASPTAITVAGRSVPVDRHGRANLHFGRFPPSSIISAEDVLRRQAPAGYFKDKLVLIGLGAEGTADIVATPLAAEEYGLLVQGEAVDAILRGGWLSRPAWAGPVEWLAGAMLALLALGIGWRPKWPRLVFPLLLVALPVASWLLFAKESLLLDPVRPALLGGGALAGVVVGLFGEARRERERLRDALVHQRIAAAETEGELRTARAIQLGMVPTRRELAAIDPRLEIDALLEPAKSVGGDLYDCVRIGPDTVGFAIGDVTGKGVPAALFMAMSKALTSSALCRQQGDLKRAANDINRDLMRNNEEVMSVTMIVGQIDLATGAVSLACAGHEDPYVLDRMGTVRRIRLDGGPPFSTIEYDYPVESLTLARGETLVLVTDGITEAQDNGRTLYGREHLVKKLEGIEPSSTAICEAIRDDVRRFEANDDPTDDLTIMAIRYIGTAS
jgi:serine phosphatase RsbU (regulator of sigma subunit)/CHASE2 domain-containing sensor protein